MYISTLRNMGVAASMSISVVKDGRLWGLIACHHTGARQLPHAIRITCEVLASVFSSHISAAEEQEQRIHVTALRDLKSRHVEARLRQDGDVAGTLTEMGQEILIAMEAEGCIFSIRGKMVSCGTTPGHAHAEALLTWLDTNQGEHVFATERMAELYPDADQSHLLLGGLLSVRIGSGKSPTSFCGSGRRSYRW